MATGTRVGTSPGTALIAIPGPLYEFARDSESVELSEATRTALDGARIGNAPKGYGAHIIATREIVDELREIADQATASAAIYDEASSFGPNLRAGAKRFLKRTEPGLIKYAQPKIEPVADAETATDADLNGEPASGETEVDAETEALADALAQSLAERGVEVEGEAEGDKPEPVVPDDVEPEPVDQPEPEADPTEVEPNEPEDVTESGEQPATEGEGEGSTEAEEEAEQA